MKRLLLLTSAMLLPLAATPVLAIDATHAPRPMVEAYALAPQATLAMPTLLPGSAGMAALPATIANASAAGSLSQGPRLEMASIGGVLSPGATGASAADRQAARSDAPGERLPSTPIALATLFLMICILIRRRNGPDRI